MGSHREHLLGTSQDERQVEEKAYATIEAQAQEDASKKQVDSLYYPQQALRLTGCFYQLVHTFCLCDDFYWNDVQARDAPSTTCLSTKEHLTKIIVQLCEDVSSFPCYHVY